MRCSKLFHALVAAIVLIHAGAASAAGAIDMDDPRRLVGREDDVRIDAVLVQDTVSPGSVIGVTYQIQNFSSAPVAVAPNVMNASYDSDSRTITLAVGAEVPDKGKMPQVVMIAPGQKKVFRGGATPSLNPAALRATRSAPRYVQVKVSILRNVQAFENVSGGDVLNDAQFDQWFESNDTILLNTVPVRFSPRRTTNSGGADRRGASASF